MIRIDINIERVYKQRRGSTFALCDFRWMTFAVRRKSGVLDMSVKRKNLITFGLSLGF